MKTLISKTFSHFAVCCVLLFMVSAPLFYLVTKYFYAEDMTDIIEAVERGEDIPQLDLERDITEGMMIQFVLIFVIVSASLYVTMRFVTRKLWLPFDDTLRKAESFNVAQGDIPVFLSTDISEFDRLNNTLEKMMERSRETYRIQKEFTENASHELQTPLAVIRSKLDLLMQEKLDERTLSVIADLYRLNTRMGHLNRNLLLLAKIDNRQYSEIVSVNLKQFISDRLAVFSTLKPGMTIELQAGNDNHLKLKANITLLESLIDNLVVNALRHTPQPSGTVSIILSDNGFSVRNTSDGRSLDNTDIFRRFARAHSDGNGLGLAIAKAICDYHGWTISYRHCESRHCFIVRTK